MESVQKKKDCFGACEHEAEHKATLERIRQEVLSSNDVEQVCRTFQMLSDPGRLKIVLALLKGDVCVFHLTEMCDSTQSAVSHQLRILRDNKIVKAKRMGKNVEYSIADAHIREIVETGIRHLRCTLEN